MRFESSELITRLWPRSVREATLAAFAEQKFINRSHAMAYGGPGLSRDEWNSLLTASRLRLPVLGAMGVSEGDIKAARHAEERKIDDPLIDEILGADALADRDFGRASSRLERAERGPHAATLQPLRRIALDLALKQRAAQVPSAP